MDIQRQPPKFKNVPTGKILGALLIASVLALAFGMFWEQGIKEIKRGSVSFATVQRGPMAVKVFGNGVLVPKEIRWVATNVPGRVNRIFVKAGAQVEQGQALIELDNPELVQAADERRWEFEASQAELIAEEVNLESNVMDQKARVRTVELDLESAQFQYNAETELVKGGNSSISRLDHKRSELRVRQLKNDLAVEKARLERLEKNKEASLNARSARLRTLENAMIRAQQNVDSLVVVAQAQGVVQDVAIDLGQRLTIGTNLVKVADQSELIAELKIPERMINDVLVGQAAFVDTRKNIIEGKVVRIDPAVVLGAVLVEIEFSNALPKEARPDLTVSGQVLIADIDDALFVERPVMAQSQQKGVVYVVNQSGDAADRVQVAYGKGSSNQIQILSGLSAGQSIIVSDHSSWEHLSKIRIQ